MKIFTPENQNYWKVSSVIQRMFIGDRLWGRVRLVVVLAFALVFATLSSVVLDYTAVASFVNQWVTKVRWLEVIPSPILQLFGWVFTPDGRRYLEAPLLGIIIALLISARYVQDIYDMPNLKLGFKYILASLFSFDYPRLVIAEGKKIIPEGETNLIETIGGPGYVIIRPGNIVLFERLTSPSNVRAAGSHFISRLEILKDIANLEDQHAGIETIAATTLDGIEMEVRDVRFRYRLRTGVRPGDYAERTPENPYPFSVHAMRNMAYNRVVTKKGLSDWQSSVSSIVRGVIADYVYKRRIDQLTAPAANDTNPRAELRAEFFTAAVRERFKSVGAELLWLDVGHFEIVNPAVDEQRLDTWQAKWVGDANIERAYGEAQRMALQELGRAEAQAEMLMSIVQTLEETGISDNPDNVRKIILARTAQILDAISQEERTSITGYFRTQPVEKKPHAG